MRTWMLALLSVTMFTTLPSLAAEFGSTWRVEFENVGDTAASYDVGTSTYTIGEGQQFRANVFVNSTASYKGLGLSFGWGSADHMDEGALNTNSAFTMNSVDIDPTRAFVQYMLPGEAGTGLGGFRQTGDTTGLVTGARPYGQYLSMYSGENAVEAGDLKVASFLLTNNLTKGSNSSLIIWDAAAGATWTSMLVASNDDFSRPGGSVSYNINSVPEPGSLIAMGGAGAGVLVNLLRQRKRKRC